MEKLNNFMRTDVVCIEDQETGQLLYAGDICSDELSGNEIEIHEFKWCYETNQILAVDTYGNEFEPQYLIVTEKYNPN